VGAGSAEAIRALGVVKTNLDSGQFTAIQRAAIAALEGPPEHLDELRATYQRRRPGRRDPERARVVAQAAARLVLRLGAGARGRHVDLVRRPTPRHDRRVRRARQRLRRRGEGFVRFSLTVPDDRLAEAMDRIAKALE
jgi:Aspartate/tyrosine/aromatic aminotransferase